MPIEILMPALSPTMEEGTLAKWLVKEGDTVTSGDVMAEIETDKATMEFEAVDEGVIGKILVAEGTEGVKVNTPIAVLLEEGEDAPTTSAPAPRRGRGRRRRRRRRTRRPDRRPRPTAGAGRATTPPCRRRRASGAGRRPAPRAASGSSPRRSPAASRPRRGSTSRRSRARARTAGS